jgi:hypothetical protein
MAVNEAPEKIYVHVKKGRILNTWNSEWIGVNDIEYTRTDAFIESAEKYFKTQFINDVSVLSGGVVNINFSTAIKNFVKYMKGE